MASARPRASRGIRGRPRCRRRGPRRSRPSRPAAPRRRAPNPRQGRGWCRTRTTETGSAVPRSSASYRRLAGVVHDDDGAGTDRLGRRWLPRTVARLAGALCDSTSATTPGPSSCGRRECSVVAVRRGDAGVGRDLGRRRPGAVVGRRGPLAHLAQVPGIDAEAAPGPVHDTAHRRPPLGGAVSELEAAHRIQQVPREPAATAMAPSQGEVVPRQVVGAPRLVGVDRPVVAQGVVAARRGQPVRHLPGADDIDEHRESRRPAPGSRSRSPRTRRRAPRREALPHPPRPATPTSLPTWKRRRGRARRAGRGGGRRSRCGPNGARRPGRRPRPLPPRRGRSSRPGRPVPPRAESGRCNSTMSSSHR